MNGTKAASSKKNHHTSLWKLFQQDLCETRRSESSSSGEAITSGERGTKDEEDASSMPELEECGIRFSSEEEKESLYICCHEEFPPEIEDTIEEHQSHPQALAEAPEDALLVGHFIQDSPDFFVVDQQVLPWKPHHPSSSSSSIRGRLKEGILPLRRFRRSCESMNDMLKTFVDADFNDSRRGRMIATENAARLVKMESRSKRNRCFTGGRLLCLYSEHYEHYHQHCFHPPPQLGQTPCHRKHKSCSSIDESRPCALRMNDSSLKEAAEEMDRLWQDHNDAFPDHCRRRRNHSPSLGQECAGHESDKKSKASWKKISESKGTVLMSLRSHSLGNASSPTKTLQGLARILTRCLTKPL